MLRDADIQRITDAIVGGGRPLAVGVFGSYGVDLPKPHSDLDLFVITDTTARPAARRKAVQRLLFSVLHPLDIHVFTPEEFEAEVYEYLSFAWVIVRQAKLYYLSNAALTRVPSLQMALDRREGAVAELERPDQAQR
jgi:predicted nucleotidyltransferase